MTSRHCLVSDGARVQFSSRAALCAALCGVLECCIGQGHPVSFCDRIAVTTCFLSPLRPYTASQLMIDENRLSFFPCGTASKSRPMFKESVRVMRQEMPVDLVGNRTQHGTTACADAIIRHPLRDEAPIGCSRQCQRCWARICAWPVCRFSGIWCGGVSVLADTRLHAQPSCPLFTYWACEPNRLCGRYALTQGRGDRRRRDASYQTT